MKIISTNISPEPVTFTWMGQEETTGIYKKPTGKPIFLRKNDVFGNESSIQLDHGGFYKAIDNFLAKQLPYL